MTNAKKTLAAGLLTAASLGGATDADLYPFTLGGAVGTTASSLQITANGGTSSTQVGSAIDTSLFLFNSAGTPVLANDDASNASYQGQLNLIGLPAGTYYLGIALSGNEAINSASQQLFTVDQPTTAQRGVASGLNPATLSTFNSQEFTAETGTYSIGFAVVPEPSTWATIVLGGAALGLGLRRRRTWQA